MSLLRIWAVVICLALLGAGAAHAQGVLERLVSPGPLAARHANLESRCNACHAAFDPNAQTRLCSACHRPVAADIAAHTGFHGHDRRAASSACGACHTEHKGRGADIIGLNPRGFDHSATDYPLHGAHVGVACASCHAAGRKFRDAPDNCVDCHRADEPHHGRLGAQCESCHVDAAWREIHFDHSHTGFPLTGAHARARCVTCHAQERYAGTPTGCVDCHRGDDAHSGSLGENCGGCHSTDGWRVQRFDHDRTQFPLHGRHATIQCAACHVQPAGRVRLPTTCYACHRNDDAHHGLNGQECQQCHTETDWRRATFDHARQTHFPLRGAHASLACARCHVQPARQVHLDMACISCHRGDDAHQGQEGAQCAQCHSETAWRGSVRFDHGLTSFPLIGEHVRQPCSACHTNSRFKDAPSQCAACHDKDDRHEGRLGPDCGACHNPVSWTSWRFDHDTQTDFALTGAHKDLQCEACHTERARGRVRQSPSCISCHRGDDAHRGEFGPECGRCHTTDSFRGARPR
jgi:hypothetical protein